MIDIEKESLALALKLENQQRTAAQRGVYTSGKVKNDRRNEIAALRGIGQGGPPIRTTRPPGRNDPCPCGSGKKFKKCCRLRGEL